MESVFGPLESECFRLARFADIEDLRKGIAEYSCGCLPISTRWARMESAECSKVIKIRRKSVDRVTLALEKKFSQCVATR